MLRQIFTFTLVGPDVPLQPRLCIRIILWLWYSQSRHQHPYPHNATSVSPNSVTPQAKHANKFVTAFLHVQEVTARRYFYGPIWPLMEIFGDKPRKSMEIVRAHLDPIIEEAVSKKAKDAKNVMNEGEESSIVEGETLIDHLVRLSSGERPLKLS